VAFLLAVLCFGAAAYWALQGCRRFTDWDSAPGHVMKLRIEGGSRMFATVQFTAANGRLYRVEEPCAWETGVGQPVDVRYRTEDPNEAMIDGEVDSLVGSLGPVVGSIFLVILGFVCLNWWRLSH
jgi:hypothetical protein